MKIACIGWGSLIWNPGTLKIKNKWFDDGPLLPVEFTRIASNNRVTLIIDKESKHVRTLWSLMTTDDIEDAKTSLRQREGISEKNKCLIHSVASEFTGNNEHKINIANWLKSKNLDFGIWTGLSYNKNKQKKERPTIEFILNHLRDLDSIEFKVAEEYIRKAPKQIDTEFRRIIEREFGWYS